MEKDKTCEGIHDFAAGRLSKTAEEEFREHLAGCSDCREMLSLGNLLAETGCDDPDDLFPSHPSPDEIVRFALTPDKFDSVDLAIIGQHVHECPACRDAVAFARRSDKVVPIGRRSGIRELFSRASSPLMNYAAAATVLLLLYPAYLGLFERGDTGQVPDATWVGGVQTLVPVSSLHRSDDSNAVPIYEIRSGQPYSSILIADRVFLNAVGTADSLSISLIRMDDQVTIHDLRLRRDELVEPSSRVISLMIPTSDLAPGEYQLRAARADSSAVYYEGFFQIRAEAAPQNDQ